jgi:membrane-bound lytic murein transglycosylase B
MGQGELPNEAVTTTAIPTRQPLSTQPLPGNPAPDSYAYRTDARALAAELAQKWALDPDWVWRNLSGAKYIEASTRLVMPAVAPTAKNWTAYRNRFIEPLRIRAGVNFWRTYDADLKRAEIQYGVPSAVIAGVLGVETIYGQNTGNFRTLDVLSTLSLDFPKGRSDRSVYFKEELGQFLKLCQEQGITPASVTGSYAGAIRMPQFMPSSIRRYAVDFDGDGHIDLVHSPVDAIGSIAHYLEAHGWQAPWPAYFEVTPPQSSDALATLLAPDILPSFSVKDMQNLGASLPAAAQDYPGQLALVQLFNGPDAKPTMIAGTVNFYAITRYNQSSYYALAVIQLGDAVARAQSLRNPQTP